MSIISSRTLSSTTTSILKSSGSSRERAKNLLAKVRFETPTDRKVLNVLTQVIEDQNVVEYEKFLCFIHEGRCDDQELYEIIEDSRNCISLLSQTFRAYVEILIDVKWQKKNEKFIDEYKHFIVDLVVAHNRYCSMVISKLVGKLLPQEDQMDTWKMGTPDEEQKTEINHTLDLICRILDIIPMAFDIVLKQISLHFPFYKKPSAIIGGYIHNLLELLRCQPIFMEDIIHLIVSKLLEVDVNISRQDIEDSENKDEEDDENIGEKITEIKVEKDENEMEHPIAETLDIGMTKILDFIKIEMEKTKVDQDKLSSILFNVFETDILPTHNSHHVQFILFYLCHFKTAILEKFIEKLWMNIENINMAHGLRQASVGYLASFLARSKFISLNVVRKVLSDMSEWAHSYISRSDTISCSLRAHTVFYSVCQAIFYIIAFRSRELTADRRSLLHLNSLQLQSLVTCHLNPLRVCLPAVATTFAGVTRTYQIAYCYAVIERNARRKLATIYNNETSQMPDECLDTFFPFDPYLLKKSTKFISELYLHYKASEHEDNSLVDSKGMKRPEPGDNEDDDNDDFICDSQIKRFKVEENDFDLHR